MKRKFIFLILLIFSNSNCEIYSINSTSTSDIIIDTIDYSDNNFYYQAGRKNEMASLILDSIERLAIKDNYKVIPLHKIYVMRAFLASRQLRPRLALKYLKKAFLLNELKQDTPTYFLAAKLMLNEYTILKQMDKATEYALLALNIANKTNDKEKVANAFMNLQLCYSHLGESGKSLQNLEKMRMTMIEQPEKYGKILLVTCLGIESFISRKMKQYEKSISLYLDLLDLYLGMTDDERKGTEVESDEGMDFKIAQTHITLATLYVLKENFEKGEYHYNKFEEYLKLPQEVLSTELYDMAIGYNITTKKYDSALKNTRYLEAMGLLGSDSINICNLAAKKYLSRIYGLLGEYEKAWEYQKSASIISDSLYLRSNYQIALELATVYEMAEKEAQIQEEITANTRARIWIVSLFFGVFILIILLLIIWVHSKRIVTKNKSLFQQLNQLSEAKKELDRIRSAINTPKPVDSKDKGNQLFYNLNKYLYEGQKFLDPYISREQLAIELGTNKLYLSNAIMENSSQTFNEYINFLRLEYAKDLLLKDYKTKIQVISNLSGFNSVRTFYRLFLKTYHMTPSEFRKIASTIKK